MEKLRDRDASPGVEKTPVDAPESPAEDVKPAERAETDAGRPREIGGPKGPEPTRYGDWERNGRCSDF